MLINLSFLNVEGVCDLGFSLGIGTLRMTSPLDPMPSSALRIWAAIIRSCLVAVSTTFIAASAEGDIANDISVEAMIFSVLFSPSAA